MKRHYKFLLSLFLILAVLITDFAGTIPETTPKAQAAGSGMPYSKYQTWNYWGQEPGGAGAVGIPDGYMPLGTDTSGSGSYTRTHFRIIKASTGQIQTRENVSSLWGGVGTVVPVPAGFVPLDYSFGATTKNRMMHPSNGQILVKADGDGAWAVEGMTIGLPAGYSPAGADFEYAGDAIQIVIINRASGDTMFRLDWQGGWQPTGDPAAPVPANISSGGMYLSQGKRVFRAFEHTFTPAAEPGMPNTVWAVSGMGATKTYRNVTSWFPSMTNAKGILAYPGSTVYGGVNARNYYYAVLYNDGTVKRNGRYVQCYNFNGCSVVRDEWTYNEDHTTDYSGLQYNAKYGHAFYAGGTVWYMNDGRVLQLVPGYSTPSDITSYFSGKNPGQYKWAQLTEVCDSDSGSCTGYVEASLYPDGSSYGAPADWPQGYAGATSIANYGDAPASEGYLSKYVAYAAPPDSTPPTPPGIYPSTGGWTSGNVSVSMGHGSDTESGVNRSEYYLSGATSTGWTTYTGGFWIVNEGVTTIVGRTIDNAGNVSGNSVVNVYIDKSGPAGPGMSTTPGGWHNGWTTLNMWNGWDALSGFSRYQYSLDSGASWADLWGPNVNLWLGEGAHTIYGREIDNVGWGGGWASTVAYVDNTAPNNPGINLSNWGWSSTNVNAYLSHGWDGTSGTNRTEWTMGGATSIGWTVWDGSTLTISNEGVTTLYSRSVDNAGNYSGNAQVNIYIDKSAPAGPGMSTTPAGWTSGNVTINFWNAWDALSGFSRYQYSVDNTWSWVDMWGVSNVTLNLGDGVHTIYGREIDNVGWGSGLASTVAYVDKTAPNNPGIGLSNWGWSPTNITVSMSHGWDGMSGANRTEYYLGGATSTGWTLYTGAYTISNEGVTTITGRTFDNAANVSGNNVQNAYVDKTAPTTPSVAVSPSAWTNGNVTVTITPGTDGTSGVNRTEYLLSGATSQVWTTYTGAFTVVNEGITNIYARTIDNATNISAQGSNTALIDRTPPLLDPVSIISNNANTTMAKVGDTVTITFKATETLYATPVIDIGSGRTVVPSTGDNVNYLATFTAMSGDTEGMYPVTIMNVKDRAANYDHVVYGTTDLTAVEFDKTPPVLPTVSVRSSNANPQQATIGDTITVSFTSSEQLRTNPSGTIFGRAATVNNVGGNNYTATVVVTAADPAGAIPFQISNLVDLAGNLGTNVSTTTDGSSVSSSGGTPPIISGLTIGSSNSNPSRAVVGDTVTVVITSTTPLDPTTRVVIGGSTIPLTNTGPNQYTGSKIMSPGDTPGTVAIKVTPVKDTAGNTSPDVSNTTNGSSVVFDTTSATMSVVRILSSNPTTNIAKQGDMVTVEFTSSKALSVTPTVTISSRAASVTALGGNAYRARINMVSGDSEGNVLFVVSNIKDTSGNTSGAVSSTTDGSNVTYDKTAPTMTVVTMSSTGGANPAPGDTLTLNFTASEALRSVPNVQVMGTVVSAVPTGTNSWKSTYTIPAGSNGPITFLISGIVDKGGNTGGSVSSTTDGSGPSSTVSSNNIVVLTITGVTEGGVYAGSAVPLFSASSTAGDITTLNGTMDGGNTVSGTPVSSAGPHTLFVTATDSVGNTNTATVHFTVVP
jgi:hypothetical protein